MVTENPRASADGLNDSDTGLKGLNYQGDSNAGEGQPPPLMSAITATNGWWSTASYSGRTQLNAWSPARCLHGRFSPALRFLAHGMSDPLSVRFRGSSPFCAATNNLAGLAREKT